MGDPTALQLLADLPMPVCAALMPFEVLDADRERGWVRLRFEPQPAFTNHFGAVQGGFLVAMLDVPLSLAVYAKTGSLHPTVEIKTSFLAPAPLEPLTAEGTVLRAGSRVVFSEARIWSESSQLLAHATATAVRSPGEPSD